MRHNYEQFIWINDRIAQANASYGIIAQSRTDLQGVAMHKPNEAGYNNENIYVIDDWR